MSEAEARGGGSAAAPQGGAQGLTGDDMAARLRRIADDLEAQEQGQDPQTMQDLLEAEQDQERPALTDGAGAAIEQAPDAQVMGQLERLWPASPRLTAAVGMLGLAYAFATDATAPGGVALIVGALALVGFSIELARGHTYREKGGGA